MDAQLIARELEMTLLAKLLEQPRVDGNSNLMMPAAALLHLLRQYLGEHLVLEDLHRAVRASGALARGAYSREIEVGGVRSDEGVTLSVYHLAGALATRSRLGRELGQHTGRPRPPVAATTYAGGVIGAKGEEFELHNEGYGPQDAVTLRSVRTPDWLTGRRRGRCVTLTPCPPGGGVYRGEVCVRTDAGDVTLPVSTVSAAFAVPPRPEVTLEELLPEHPDLDREATGPLLDRCLRQLGYERLPGGLYLQRAAHAVQERTAGWWLTEAEVLSGSLVGRGYPARFTVYADGYADGEDVSAEVEAGNGPLTGLAVLFDILDIQPGQRLTLEPYRGGYRAVFGQAEPWRAARGHTLWLQGPVEAVLAQPAVLAELLERCDDRSITVNLLLSGRAELPGDLARQHRAGRLSVRFTEETLPHRLIVCDEGCAAYALPHGSAQRLAAPPTAKWEAARPFDERDYREQAWQRGSRLGEAGDKLLDLELSVAMERLARALRPALPVKVPAPTPQLRQQLSALAAQAREAGLARAPLTAAPLLQQLRVSAAQVNAHGQGLRVTAGGYLVRRPQDLSGQPELARYVGTLYGGVIHHSQLRKLTEAFCGQRLDPGTFVVASLKVLGWGGNGYRRPCEAWEPQARELRPFAAEVLARLSTLAAALRWLRKHVAASEEQLARALDKAARDRVMPEKSAPETSAQSPATPAPASLRQSPAPARPERPQPAAIPASPLPRPAPPRVVFGPLRKADVALPDPRFAPPPLVREAVFQLISQEGPITETWLLRRYAAHTRLNLRVISVAVRAQLQALSDTRAVTRLELPGGHVEYLHPGQQVALRERGERNPEDIAFGEWCELLRALGLSSGACDKERAFQEARRAYRFGTDAGHVRLLVELALSRA